MALVWIQDKQDPGKVHMSLTLGSGPDSKTLRFAMAQDHIYRLATSQRDVPAGWVDLHYLADGVEGFERMRVEGLVAPPPSEVFRPTRAPQGGAPTVAPNEKAPLICHLEYAISRGDMFNVEGRWLSRTGWSPVREWISVDAEIIAKQDAWRFIGAVWRKGLVGEPPGYVFLAKTDGGKGGLVRLGVHSGLAARMNDGFADGDRDSVFLHLDDKGKVDEMAFPRKGLAVLSRKDTMFPEVTSVIPPLAQQRDGEPRPISFAFSRRTADTKTTFWLREDGWVVSEAWHAGTLATVEQAVVSSKSPVMLIGGVIAAAAIGGAAYMFLGGSPVPSEPAATVEAGANVIQKPVEPPKPAPTVAETPKVVEAPKPAPVVTEAPKPAPVVAEAPKPVEAPKPAPTVAEAPKVVEAPKPAPVVTEAPKPAPVVAEAPKPVEAPKPAPVVAAPPKPAPQAVADTASTKSGTPVTIDVLANDKGEGLSLRSVAGFSHGSAVVTDGKVVYTPQPGFTGTDRGTYVLTSTGGSTEGSIAIDVLNQPPRVTPLSVRVVDAMPATILPLSSAEDPEGQPLTLIYCADPAAGALSRQGDAIVYTPKPSLKDSDSFVCEIRDTAGATAKLPVTIVHVVTPNHPPVANDDSFVMGDATSATIQVLANDTDPDGDPLTITGIDQPANGTATISGSGVIYQPKDGFVGTDRFAYRISDGKDGTATATVTVEVGTPPAAQPVSASTDQGAAVTIDVLAAAQGKGISITSASGFTNGKARVLPTGRIEYTPTAGFSGTDTGEYVVTNPKGSARSTVKIEVAKAADTDASPAARGEALLKEARKETSLDRRLAYLSEAARLGNAEAAYLAGQLLDPSQSAGDRAQNARPDRALYYYGLSMSLGYPDARKGLEGLANWAKNEISTNSDNNDARNVFMKVQQLLNP